MHLATHRPDVICKAGDWPRAYVNFMAVTWPLNRGGKGAFPVITDQSRATAIASSLAVITNQSEGLSVRLCSSAGEMSLSF